MNIERLLHLVGEFGPFQKLQYALLCFFLMLIAPLQMDFVFQSATPRHRCHVPLKLLDHLAVNHNMSGSSALDLLLPRSSSNPAYHSSCQQWLDAFEIVLEPNCWKKEDKRQFLCQDRLVEVEDCSYGHHFDEIFGHTYVVEWNLICSRAYLKPIVRTSYFAGQIFGGFLFGYFADRYGRKPIILITLAMAFITSFMLSLLQNLFMFMLISFIKGSAIKGFFPAVSSLAIEQVGAKYRSRALFCRNSLRPFGLIFLSVAAFLIGDWRRLELFFGFPIFFCFLFGFFLEESPRWLLSQNRKQDVIRILVRYRDWSHASVSDEELNQLEMVPNHFHQHPNDYDNARRHWTKSTLNYMQLLHLPKLANITFSLCLAWFITSATISSIGMNSESLVGNFFVNFAMLSCLSLPANLTSLFFVDRFGRRPVIISCQIIGALMLCFSNSITPDASYSGMKTVMASFGKYFVLMSQTSLQFYTTELFPTEARNVGLGICNGAGALGGMAAPYIVYAIDFFPQLPFLLCAMMLVISASQVAFFLPETRDRPLFETFEEMDSKTK